ncbi:MAG: hypothetical protein KKA62_03935 [Nanoarchaeota archaeon]|nr:hypothetical protein [Nanoarchaeota archaeon]MBU1644660.1 hypothetical protein [Nanoarchaeota archaeon]MBU1977075.1 hypothetical protein [Nanoarchaeota archaeon]
MTKKGRFVVVDGIDGVGKGVFLDTFVEEAKKDSKRVFDVHDFWAKNNFHPPLSLIKGNFDVVLTSEPTFMGLGTFIREELTAKNGRSYSPEIVAEAFALDRRILYEQLNLPLLKEGLDIYQSRSLSTSIVYQRQSALDQGKDFSVEEILSLPGNSFCHKHPFDFLVIPTIINVEEAVRRTKERNKDDNCKYENLDFQLKIKSHYDSKEFREIFTRAGTEIVYMDASISIKASQEQARKFYQQKLR